MCAKPSCNLSRLVRYSRTTLNKGQRVIRIIDSWQVIYMYRIFPPGLRFSGSLHPYLVYVAVSSVSAQSLYELYHSRLGCFVVKDCHVHSSSGALKWKHSKTISLCHWPQQQQQMKLVPSLQHTTHQVVSDTGWVWVQKKQLACGQLRHSDYDDNNLFCPSSVVSNNWHQQFPLAL